MMTQWPNVPVVLVGNGPVEPTLLQAWRQPDWPIIAVDGGVNTLATLGITADYVLGDMDSAKSELAAHYASAWQTIDEQQTTDFEKALYTLQAPVYIGFGFIGGRLDHTLAVLDAAVRYGTHAEVVLLDADNTVWIHSGALQLDLPANERFSIIPWPEIAFSHSQGCAYPLPEQPLRLRHSLSISNQASRPTMALTPTSTAAYILVLAYRHHKMVIDQAIAHQHGAFAAVKKIPTKR